MSGKRSVRVAARENMQKYGYDPLDVLVQFAQAPATSDATKMEIAEMLLPYMYPKLSNIAVEGELNTSVAVESQAALLRRVLENPDLADAAQRLSIAASMVILEQDSGLIQ